MLKGKHIVIGITGGIAAYKIPYLIRLLVREGALVRVVMSPAAKDFITPLPWQPYPRTTSSYTLSITKPEPGTAMLSLVNGLI